MPIASDKVNTIEINDQFLSAFYQLENTLKNIFLTGKAGTGKSTLLQYFLKHTKKNVVALAPTGVAAVNIQGQTIHSFFRFKPDITLQGVHSIKIRKTQRDIYEKIDTIVIDEISMVRADLLDCVDEFLKLYGKKKDFPFGGVQMVFFGDLFQLSPVVTPSEQEIFRDVYKSPYFFDAHSFKELDFEFFEFDKIYRQKEEKFISFLGKIRNKTITEDHLRELNYRCRPQFQPKEDELYVYLTTTNAMADRNNQQQLNRLKTENFHFKGEMTGKFDEKNLPTHKDLNIKIGAQVMLLNNDASGRWVNGTVGKVVSVIDDFIVCVELLNGNRVEVTPFTWEMFRYVFDEETQKLKAESVGAFTQYPLKLAWAITIHKSQGKTFTKVILDIGNGTFSHGQAYVALSRCTNFDGLILKKPILKKHILLDQRVVDFMKNFN